MRTKDETRAAARKSLAKRRDKLKSDGICPDCGQNPHADGKTLCAECLDARRKREENRRQGIPNDGQPGRPKGAKNYVPVIPVRGYVPPAEEMQLHIAVQDRVTEQLRVAATAASVFAESGPDGRKPTLREKIARLFRRLVGAR